MTENGSYRVVIAGGGVAALEGLLALRERVETGIEIDLLTPNSAFVHRPLELAAMFHDERVQRFDIRRIASDRGARLLTDKLDHVRAEARTAVTVGGKKLSYDSLLIATGAKLRLSIADALTLGAPGFRQDFARLLRDLESGLAHEVAFAAPAGMGWLLPLYELALLTADHLSERGTEAALSIVTYEQEPLEVFGPEASGHVRTLLDDRGISFLPARSATRRVTEGLLVAPSEVVPADQVIALPSMRGPAIAGVPQTVGGFIPTDRYGEVLEAENIFAAGDGTAFPVKQGGLAAQQAVAAASMIAWRAGSELQPEPFEPVLRGLLLTGHEPAYLRADLSHPEQPSAAASQPLWWPAAKVAARSLAPYLAARPGLQIPAAN